jgi:transcriptional regulator with XRE-family HTH domain
MISTHQKEPDATDIYVGKRVRMRRLALDMSQTNLADAVGLTFQQIQKYEQGTNRVSASRMQQFAKILEVPISFFFEGAPAAQVMGGGKKINGKAAVSPRLRHQLSREPRRADYYQGFHPNRRPKAAAQHSSFCRAASRH